MGNLILGLGFSGAREPMYCIGRLSQGEFQDPSIFSERKRATPEAVTAWISEFMTSAKIVTLKSEEVAIGQVGPVQKMVGADMVSIVADRSKDILVLILAGEESDRAAARAVLLEAAEEFEAQNVTSVRFYEIDAELNDLPSLPRSYNATSPAFVLWPAVNDKMPLMFSGKSDVLELLTLLVAHAKSRFQFKIPRKYDAGGQEL
jgi:hypothetical protein